MYNNFSRAKEKLHEFKHIKISDKPLIVIIGEEGCGKTTFSETLFGSKFKFNDKHVVVKDTTEEKFINLFENEKENSMYPTVYSDPSVPYNILDAKSLINSSCSHVDTLIINLILEFYTRKAKKVFYIFLINYDSLTNLVSVKKNADLFHSLFRSVNNRMLFVVNRCRESFICDEEFLEKNKEERVEFITENLISYLKKYISEEKNKNNLFIQKINTEISQKQKLRYSSSKRNDSHISVNENELFESGPMFLFNVYNEIEGANRDDVEESLRRLSFFGSMEKAIDNKRIRYYDPTNEYSVNEIKKIINEDISYADFSSVSFVNSVSDGENYVEFLNNYLTRLSNLMNYSVILRSMPSMENVLKRSEEKLEHLRKMKEENESNRRKEKIKKDDEIYKINEEINSICEGEGSGKYKDEMKEIDKEILELKFELDEEKAFEIVDISQLPTVDGDKIIIMKEFDEPFTRYEIIPSSLKKSVNVDCSDYYFYGSVSKKTLLQEVLHGANEILKLIPSVEASVAVATTAGVAAPAVVGAAIIAGKVIQPMVEYGCKAVDSSVASSSVHAFIRFFKKKKNIPQYKERMIKLKEKKKEKEFEIEKERKNPNYKNRSRMIEISEKEREKDDIDEIYNKKDNEICREIDKETETKKLAETSSAINREINRILSKFLTTINYVHLLKGSVLIPSFISSYHSFEVSFKRMEMEKNGDGNSSSSPSCSSSSYTSDDDENEALLWINNNRAVLAENNSLLSSLHEMQPLFEERDNKLIIENTNNKNGNTSSPSSSD